MTGTRCVSTCGFTGILMENPSPGGASTIQSPYPRGGPAKAVDATKLNKSDIRAACRIENLSIVVFARIFFVPDRFFFVRRPVAFECDEDGAKDRDRG